ncbi:MAG: hypothetical protein D6677_12360 [Calditrichaeota bacterium]|nr:MAG: hypothetical protein D6677_12360 [Calditrichota bacterium]
MRNGPADAFYKGFYLDKPLGNNAFSWEKRKVRRLYVPPLYVGGWDDLKPGREVVFSEWEEGREKAFAGLETFIRTDYRGVPVYVFDNHNHAFYFWYVARQQGLIPFGIDLVHVDQHSDMRMPSVFLAPEADRQAVFDYTNFTLNVGNFIQPALKLGWFGQVHVVDSSYRLGERYQTPFVLDLDMDFLAPELDYIGNDLKVKRIREWARKAVMITIATSPFFMDQEEALAWIRHIFDNKKAPR